MMKMKIIAGLAIGWLFLGCATESSRDPNTLQFVAQAPSEFKVGQTSDVWVVSRTIILANGKTDTKNPYPSFLLVSSDTTVASVVNEKQLLAKKVGQTTVTAFDLASNLRTESGSVVTVQPNP